MPFVSVNNINKAYGDLLALSGVSLEVSNGEVVALCGANGAGKSTLLQCLAGLAEPESGQILLNGSKPLKALREGFKLAYCGANTFLYGDLTVLENLELASRLANPDDSASSINQNIREISQKLSLLELFSRKARGCSQGMARRAALARALVTKPDLLLLDEPFSHLDEANRESLFSLLSELGGAGLTMFIATHEKLVSDQLASRIVLLARGRIVQDQKTSGMAHV